jgi:hypothetical protein
MSGHAERGVSVTDIGSFKEKKNTSLPPPILRVISRAFPSSGLLQGLESVQSWFPPPVGRVPIRQLMRAFSQEGRRWWMRVQVWWRARSKIGEVRSRRNVLPPNLQLLPLHLIFLLLLLLHLGPTASNSHHPKVRTSRGDHAATWQDRRQLGMGRSPAIRTMVVHLPSRYLHSQALHHSF